MATASVKTAAGSRLQAPRRRARRHFRLRKKVARHRRSVRAWSSPARSRHIVVQVIDDRAGHTLASASTHGGRRARRWTATRRPRPRKVGELSPRAPRRPASTAVVFDRGGNRYHGRIAALADAAREGGLEF